MYHIFICFKQKKSVFYSSVLIRGVQKSRIKSEKVNYLLGCHDTQAFKRLLFSNHPICDIFLFLNDYEDWKVPVSEDVLQIFGSWDVCHEQA